MKELKKSIQNRKTVSFICDYCGSEGIKAESEYKRNLKKGRKNYCSRSCAAKGNKNLKEAALKCSNSESNKKHISSLCDNRKDEFTPFRYTLRNIKKRFKEVDIDLNYLKKLWEDQKGICPYTGIKLTLPTYTSTKDIDVTVRASLDRIDSNKGYIKGNVQWISTSINYLKSTMSDLETKHFLKQISFYTSTFVEDQTISSSQKEMSDAQAGN